MEDNEKVMEYVNRLVEIENDLAGVGHLLDDKDKMKALLRGLCEDFSMTAKVIRAMKMTFTKAVSELLSEEGSRLRNRINKSKSTEAAFTTVYQNGRRICTHCGGMGHVAEQCSHNPSSKSYIREFKRRNKRTDKKTKVQNTRQEDHDTSEPSNEPPNEPPNLAMISKSVFRGNVTLPQDMNHMWMIDSASTSQICVRDVYVVPPRESTDRSHYWLLLTAAYGLVNANAKWQYQSDSLLRELGLLQLAVVPQLFYAMHNGRLVLLVAKIVDNLLATGETHRVENSIADFNNKFQHGTVAHGPGRLRFYGMNVAQDDDMSCFIDADDKLSRLWNHTY